MGLLDGRNALIFGVANDHSIAWGIARALHDEGAEVGFSSVESLIERRVRPLAESIGSTFVEACDVQSDEQIRAVFGRWAETHESLDILVHALAFARREDLEGGFVADVARGLRARPRRLGLLAGRPGSRGSSAAPPRLVRPDPVLLRGGEGRRQLQRHGGRQGGPRGVRPLPGRRPGTRRRPGERDQRRPDPDAGRLGHRRLQADVRRIRRDRAAPREHHPRGRRPVARSTSRPTCRTR